MAKTAKVTYFIFDLQLVSFAVGKNKSLGHTVGSSLFIKYPASCKQDMDKS